MRRGYWFARVLKGVVAVVVVLGVLGFLAMFLWNWLVPTLFSGPAVNYWQALGLLVLSRLLVGGLRPHGRGPFGHSWQHARARWKQMTPDEREHFRNRFRGGWHGRHGHRHEPPSV
jgi:hypothetical protein